MESNLWILLMNIVVRAILSLPTPFQKIGIFIPILLSCISICNYLHLLFPIVLFAHFGRDQTID